MISLPTKWCHEYNLQKGGEVDVEIKEGSVLINATPHAQRRETTIALAGLVESAIRTVITNTYRTGFDRIRVNIANDEQYSIVQQVIKNNLIGFDITKKEKEYLIIENITEPGSEHFENLLTKIFYNILELFTYTSDRLKGKKPIEDYHEIESRIQQYDNFCRRVITKQNIDHERNPLFWTFLTLMIHGQRELYLANTYLDAHAFKVSKETNALLERIKAVFEHIMDAYLKKDITLLESIHAEEKTLIYNESYFLLEKKHGKESVLLYHFSASLRNFYLSSSPLIGLILRNK